MRFVSPDTLSVTRGHLTDAPGKDRCRCSPISPGTFAFTQAGATVCVRQPQLPLLRAHLRRLCSLVRLRRAEGSPLAATRARGQGQEVRCPLSNGNHNPTHRLSAIKALSTMSTVGVAHRHKVGCDASCCDRRLTPRIASSDWTSRCSSTLVRHPSGSASNANCASPPASGPQG